MFLADYTSKYCLRSMHAFIHLNTPISAVLCVHVASSVFFCLINPIRSGVGAFKAAPPNFCYHAFNSGAALLCVGDFFHEIVLHRAAKKHFD